MSKNSEYPTLSDYDLRILKERTRDISASPYRLFLAFVLSSISDALEPDDIEEDIRQSVWGRTIPVDIFDRMFNSCLDDFVEAIQNHITIEVFGKPYSIRNAKSVSIEKLAESVQFPVYNDEYSICKMGFKNVESEQLSDFASQRRELKDDLAYIRKIIYLANDDYNDGWNKLTDIELAAYLWVYYTARAVAKQRRINDKYMVEWYQKRLLKYANLPMATIRSMWSSRVKIVEQADSITTFSAEKMRKWNEENRQSSEIDNISNEEADNYWYKSDSKTFE